MNLVYSIYNLIRRTRRKNWLSQKERCLQSFDNYTSAGTIFTDGRLILAGYQPHKMYISGIGGSKKPHETYTETALREMLEELFEINKIPGPLISDIVNTVKPQKVLQNKQYVMLVYTFTDLDRILELLSKYDLSSRAYDTIPTTLLELLFSRKFHEKNEISHLCLLPLIRSSIDSYLLEDIKLLNS